MSWEHLRLPAARCVQVDGVEIRAGSRVTLAPRPGGDIMDIALQGRTAIVEAVEQDVDGDTHVAVTLDDDPATELLEWQGRYYYFHPDEIEVGP